MIRPIEKAIYAEGATAVLKRQFGPARRGHEAVSRGAAPAASTVARPIVFRDYNHMAAEVERDDLDVTPDHVLVLQNAGPKGGPGMPEWGMLPIPRKLVRAGVRDMLRISDGRMSGTSYGACILHVAPESFVGGPLALVETGDEIEVDAAQRRLHLHVSDEELAPRRAAWVALPPRYERGYGRMFQGISVKRTTAATSISSSTALEAPEPEILTNPAIGAGVEASPAQCKAALAWC